MLNRPLAFAGIASLVIVAGVSAGCSSPAAPGTIALKVSAVQPSSGSPIASTPIRIVGFGFADGAKLMLGGVAIDPVIESSAVLTATAPPHAVGPVDIVVTNPAGETSRLAGGFEYTYPVTSVVLSGKTALQASGDTSQLTLIARYTDGSTRDVTNQAGWHVDQPGIATIATDGRVTAHGFGTTSFYVQYPVAPPSLYASGRITVSPPGTFTLAGWIREPGAGPVQGARVVNGVSGQSTLTGVEGDYSLFGLTDVHLSVSRDDYEPTGFDGIADGFVDTPIQRVVRFAAGSAARNGSLAPNDMDYLVTPDTHCQPCRLMRITSSTSGTMHVRVTWTDSSVLNIWVNGQLFPASGTQEVVADLPLAAGEMVLYLGKISPTPTHTDGGPKVPFSISTTIISPPRGVADSASRRD